MPAEITVFEDRSFTFVLKTPPASDLLKKAAGIEKGSAPAEAREGRHRSPQTQLREIAEVKLKDLNAYDVDAAMKMIAGTARTWASTSSLGARHAPRSPG